MEKKKRPYKAGRKSASRKSWAPSGYLTLSQALARIKYMPESTFKAYVNDGSIPKYIPEFKKDRPRANGYYSEAVINELAAQYESLSVMTKGTPIVLDLSVAKTHDHIETRPARPEDEDEVVAILTDRGWPAASADQRRSWLKVNPYLDYIATAPGEDGTPHVVGYIYAAPFVKQTMVAFMNGRMRGKDARPQDHRPYIAGETYDIYVGIATIEVGKGPNGESLTNPLYGSKLLTGFLGFLQDLGRQGVRIRYLYALSDQPHAMDMCVRLGFKAYGTTSFFDNPEQTPTKYRLDLERSRARFARLYRLALEK